MPVPLLDLKPQNSALEPELRAAFERVLRSGQFILGPELEAFEREVRPLTGARHALGLSSGTDALLLALMALGIGPGDEVLCPSFTFFATAGSIARVGARPVFAEACPACFNLDVEDAAARITPRTKAIMPVHLFGQMADMDAVMALAARHGLAVIEDGAQALGAAFRGGKAGSIGTFGTFSFFPSKNLGGFGDSGLLTTNDDALAHRAALLRVHGAEPKYHHKLVGANFRMDPIQAALLRVKLPHYAEYTRRRQANAAHYTGRLGGLAGVATGAPGRAGCCGDSKTGAPPRLILPRACAHNEAIWNQYTLRVPGAGRRDALKAHLAGRGIGSEIYYPVPMHRQECFASFVAGAAAMPVTDLLAGEVLSIPIYPELSRAQLDEVADAIAGWLAKG